MQRDLLVARFSNSTKSPIPERLRYARTRAGISQMNLGVNAGLDPSVASTRVNQYERGVHAPGYPTIQRFADVLGVPAAYFYCEDERVAAVLLQLKRLNEADFLALQEWLSAR